ncbi:esterase/lipase family protein [Streptomyces gamaensis]|uniref:Esterase/lipase family protein n=1 Tax=Streptomyces gamaensis TaxID=1763542 RepID=A0ABW0YSX2_9ACTN
MRLPWSRIRALSAAAALALAATVLGAAPATAAPTPTASSASAASSTVTSGWNDYSCRPSAAHPRPVVLVHGTMGNATDNWLLIAPYLKNRGYCVFSFDYGQVKGIPVMYGLAPAAEGVDKLKTFVDRVLTATGTDKVDLVAHSQGSMIARGYMKFEGGAPKVNALVAIAPNNQGTTLVGLTKLMDAVPGARGLITMTLPGLTDQAIGSDFLKRLNEGGDTLPGIKYTIITTKYDEIVTPHSGNYLTGPGDIHNVQLQDLCPVDASMHITVAFDRLAAHEIANALDPANASRTTCASVVLD